MPPEQLVDVPVPQVQVRDLPEVWSHEQETRFLGEPPQAVGGSGGGQACPSGRGADG